MAKQKKWYRLDCALDFEKLDTVTYSTVLHRRGCVQGWVQAWVVGCRDGSRYVEGVIGSKFPGFCESWFLGVLDSWFLGVRVSGFLSFKISC